MAEEWLRADVMLASCLLVGLLLAHVNMLTQSLLFHLISPYGTIRVLLGCTRAMWVLAV